MPEAPVVCDTGPLIAFALVDSLELLRKLFPRVIVPTAVLAEIEAGGVDRPGTRTIPSATWIEPIEPAGIDPLLASELGPGEAAVIAIAHRLDARLVVLDDRKARRIAAHAYHLPIKGTVGLLVTAKRRGLIEQVRPLLDELISQGYYLSDRVVERAIREAGEAGPPPRP